MNQCEGMTKKGQRCKNTQMCHIHRGLDIFTDYVPREKNGEANALREKLLMDPTTDMHQKFVKCLRETFECDASDLVHAGGLQNSYDFEFNGNKIEFKNNAQKFKKLPQISSVYVNKFPFASETCSYDRYYYEHYLARYVALMESPVDIPLYEYYTTHLNTIGKKRWINFFKQLYDDREHNIEAKNNLVNESIREYIKQISFDVDGFYAKIKPMNQEKLFVFHHEGEFTSKRVLESDFEPERTYSKTKNSIVIGNWRLLLRWKNRKGIMGPAWQIKLVEPSPTPSLTEHRSQNST